MAKATISMCMSTTGFGTASSLASQSLSSPGGYFSAVTSTGASISKSDTPVPTELQSSRQRADSERRKLPRFDMNLKDLFTDDELGRRTQAAMQTAVRQSPQLVRTTSMPLQQQQEVPIQDPSSAMGLYNTLSPRSTTSAAVHSPASYTSQVLPNNAAQPTYAMSNQMPYQPFAQTISQQQPDFSFENLDFLDTFPVSDPSGTAYWGNTNGNTNGGAELDFGFGMGGTAGFDGGMASDGQNWGDGGGVDLFDGFFFGNGAIGAAVRRLILNQDLASGARNRSDIEESSQNQFQHPRLWQSFDLLGQDVILRVPGHGIVDVGRSVADPAYEDQRVDQRRISLERTENVSCLAEDRWYTEDEGVCFGDLGSGELIVGDEGGDRINGFRESGGEIVCHHS
ncbi:hypothetical protein LTR95_005946 [Oleoguttula sp. CCFEE 5521]